MHHRQPGHRIVWVGNFNSHPLAGGVSPTPDGGNTISSAVGNGGSVTFNTEGDYPYFCTVHQSAMQGVIYVRGNPPANFLKGAPADTSINQPTNNLELSWGASTAGSSYEYCIDTSLDSTCNASWINNGMAISKSISGLSNGTTYQWQVRATNASATTEANTNTWWKFTTISLQESVFENGFEANGN